MRKKRRRGGRQEGRIEEGYGEGQLTLEKLLGNLLLLTDPSYGLGTVQSTRYEFHL